MSMLNPTKKPKLIEINPGSTVEVRDNSGQVETFRGVVVDRTKNFGPSRIPALYIKPDGAENTVAVSDTGKWTVSVLVDAAVIASDIPPERLVHIRPKLTTKQAVQFQGGADSAVEIVKWGGGSAAIAWRQPTSDNAEALLIHGEGGVIEEASVGDWVVRDERNRFRPVSPAEFVALYDVVDASLATPIASNQQRQQAMNAEYQQIEAAARVAMQQAHQQAPQQTGFVQ